MIQYKKALTGLLTAALLIGNVTVKASESPEAITTAEESSTPDTNETSEPTSETEKSESPSGNDETPDSEQTAEAEDSSKDDELSAPDQTAETESPSSEQETETEPPSEADETSDSEQTADTESPSENGETESAASDETAKDDQTDETETEPTTETETINDPDSSIPADVFRVILPTIAEDDTTFDYILDPQGLIELTDAEKYGGTDEVEFEHNKTLYFKTSRTDEGRPVYDNVSNALTVTNMSSREVNITVKATITSSDSVTMADSNIFDADDTSTSIYLALTDGTNTKAITSDAAVINTTIAAPEDAYETVWNGEKNVYELTDAAKESDYDGFKTYSFWLTGACNPNADWSNLENQIPEVYVVWEVE